MLYAFICNGEGIGDSVLRLKDEWVDIVEVNPPTLPDMTHVQLDGRWNHVLITDNVMGRIRVSPYAYAARITHDLPNVHPTVVVSTRDRSVFAIESEVRGALGNGIDSFFVVVGDTMPEVQHAATRGEVIEHLRSLQSEMPDFELGTPTSFREATFRRRIDSGAQFFITKAVVDPATVQPSVEKLGLSPDDPPVFVAVIPPFGVQWVERMERMGATEASTALKKRLSETSEADRRRQAWTLAQESALEAKEAGCAGIVLMGLNFGTAVSELYDAWQVTGP